MSGVVRGELGGSKIKSGVEGSQSRKCIGSMIVSQARQHGAQ